MDAAPQTLNVVAYCTLPQAAPDVHPFAVVDCQLMELDKAVLTFEPRGNAIRLRARCGCSVHVDLAAMLLELSLTRARSGCTKGVQ